MNGTSRKIKERKNRGEGKQAPTEQKEREMGTNPCNNQDLASQPHLLGKTVQPEACETPSGRGRLRLPVMYVRTKWLIFHIRANDPRMSMGYLVRELPLWADVSFLNLEPRRLTSPKGLGPPNKSEERWYTCDMVLGR